MASAINIGGTADQTLIRGAEKIAKKEYVFTKPKVDRGAAVIKSVADSIAGGMSAIKMKKEQLEVEHEKQLEPFQDIAENMYTKLAEQQEPLPQKVVDAVEAEIKRLQDEFDAVNVVGKADTRENEKARTKITAELTRITNEAINTRANFMKIGQSAGNWNSSLINSKNIDPMKSILDIGNMDKNDNISVEFIDGKLTFTTKNYSTTTEKKFGGMMPSNGEFVTPGKEVKYGDAMSFTAAQMLEALPSKNLETDAMLIGDQNSFTTQGIDDGKHGNPNYFRNTDGSKNQYAYDDEKNTLAGEITKDIFKDIQGRRVAKMGVPSFKMALRDRIDIPMSALDNMFMDKNGERIQFAEAFASMDKAGVVVDGKNEGDGFITSADLIGLEGGEITAFENNLDEIINALTDVDHPAFVLETSANLLADYYTNMKMQKYEDRYYAYGGKKPWEESSEEEETLD
jgi:hypothetical protein